MSGLLPVVGYMGGKRRVAKQIVSMMPPRLELYVEPFVGMGAVYLQLRNAGYAGPAVLADAHPCVAEFWTLVHSSHGLDLIKECQQLPAASTSADFYHRGLLAIPTDTIRRVALFLWITNYSYGNRPPGIGGSFWHLQGCKLTASKLPGRTFPWDAVIQRLTKLVERARDWCEVQVMRDALPAIAAARDDGVTYADPPYHGASEYQNQCAAVLQALARAKGHVLLSEMSDFSCPWPGVSVAMTARLSQGSGANGRREEQVFVKPRDEIGGLP